MNSYVTTIVAVVAVLILVSSSRHPTTSAAAIQQLHQRPALRDQQRQPPGEPVEIISVGALVEEMLQQRHISPLQQYHEQYHYDRTGGSDEGDDDKGNTVPGPVYTFVKTDPKANFKWGVRHYVQDKRNYH